MSKTEILKNIADNSEEVKEILTTPPHWMVRAGSTMFFIILLFILGFSCFIKYPDTIPAEAIITTVIPPQKLISKVDGRVEKLLVSNNEIVNKNQPLLVMENSANYEHVFLLNKLVDSLSYSDLRESKIMFDSLSLLDLGEIESDFSLFQTSYIEYSLNRKITPTLSSLNITKEIKDEISKRIKVLKEQFQISRKKLLLEKAELTRIQSLYKGKVESLRSYEAAQIKYLESENSLKNNEITISQLSQNLLDIDLNINVVSYEKDLNEIMLLTKVISSFNNLQKTLEEWKLKYISMAKMQGKITFIEIWNENQFVEVGDLLLTIVPNKQMQYIARLKTNTKNLGKVQKGQKVNIRLKNYPVEQFGVLTGFIKNISLIPNKDGLHIIEVELPNLISSYRIELPFNQEMAGNAEIITEELILVERIFYKFKSIFTNNINS